MEPKSQPTPPATNEAPAVPAPNVTARLRRTETDHGGVYTLSLHLDGRWHTVSGILADDVLAALRAAGTPEVA